MLVLIYNHSLTQNTAPDDWRQANVAPAFKKGRKYDAAYPNRPARFIVSVAKRWSI